MQTRESIMRLGQAVDYISERGGLYIINTGDDGASYNSKLRLAPSPFS